MHGVTTNRSIKAGVYAPICTFFHPETEDLDLASFEKHILLAAKAGVGILIAGSNGEATHLSHTERTTLIRTARRVLDNAQLIDVPIIAGTGAGSTRETVELCREAAEAGADVAIVITSGYFAGVLAGNSKALKAWYVKVADQSPIPILLYNYPGASGGIDLDSDLITDLARTHSNIIGVKLTCGNVGKLTRICSTTSQESFITAYPREGTEEPFLVLGGFSDILLTSLYANGHGVITGLGNVTPYSIAKLYEVGTASLKDPSQLSEAQRLQGIVGRADWTVANAGVAGTKYLIQRLYGYGGDPRSPLPPIDPDVAEALWNHPHVQEIVALERSLSGGSQ
ncbi:dihydrodipicolinate synthetase [Cristinia sonorae]|uniref:Dihydrodipicolinate synthetase n=1 Tax=Cristinia sonorae TaxID=1940300 RepID=A0A8K0XUJ9_9AGAR|nr:dihydrodipicolinate synthetase [Cristinia sonorae]